MHNIIIITDTFLKLQEYVVQGAPHRHKLAVHIVPLQEKSNDKKTTAPSTEETDSSGTEETDAPGELPLPEVSAPPSLRDHGLRLNCSCREIRWCMHAGGGGRTRSRSQAIIGVLAGVMSLPEELCFQCLMSKC